MATIELGDNFTITEDSNNDLVISHGSNGDVLKYDASADAWKSIPSITTDDLSVTNAPNWQEDGNSPFTFTGGNADLSGSLADTGFDEYLFILKDVEGGNDAASGDYTLILNNDTSAKYDYLSEGGTRTGGASQIVLVSGVTDRSLGGVIYFPSLGGGSADQIGAVFDILVEDVTGTLSTRGSYSGAGDITDFKIDHGNADDLNGSIEVHYRNVG